MDQQLLPLFEIHETMNPDWSRDEILNLMIEDIEEAIEGETIMDREVPQLWYDQRDNLQSIVSGRTIWARGPMEDITSLMGVLDLHD